LPRDGDRREPWQLEGLDAANRIAWGHRADPFAPEFEALAHAVWGPLLAALEEGA
jgi:hypothetical protein